MRLEILQKNYEMSDKLREIIDKKVNKLSKYYEDDTAVKIVLKKEGEKYKMEFTANIEGTFVRSEIEGENFYDSIDILLPKIERQLVKHKTKLQKKLKKNAFREEEYLFMQAEPESVKPGVVRVKRFDLTPMSIEDAIEALDMIGHAFYIFQDDVSGKLSVVYRREDGTVGLLEPRVIE